MSNCRPGDIAYITNDYEGCKTNIGHLVLIVGEPYEDERDGLCWEIKSLGEPLWVECRELDGSITFYVDTEEIDHPDAWLRPIGNPADADDLPAELEDEVDRLQHLADQLQKA